MKQIEIIKVLSAEFGTTDVAAINKSLKAKDYNTKFRLTGPAFVHFGFTGLVKSLTPEGVKIYNVNKVNLVRYEDIETFAKAIPREERKGPPKPKVPPKKAKPKIVEADEDEDYENDDDFDELADEADDVIEDEAFAEKFVPIEKKVPRKKIQLGVPGSGSRFIPKKK